MIAVLLLLAVALGLVAWPLLRGGAALGRGLEDDGPVLRWEAERGRLLGQIRDNDLALAEGRIDPALHQATAQRLGAEAEAAVAALRGARAELAGDGMQPRAVPHPVTLAAVLAAVAGLALGTARVARWQDIDLTGTPHADGRVPLPVLPMDADGTPDIGAMVAGLETRVAAGGASADEIKMLLRSYDTLGRIEDAREVLRAALARFPDDPDFQIGFLRAVIAAPAEGDMARALPVAEALIATLPDLLEARWYRSLILARTGQPEAARRELMWLTPRLPPGSPAGQAVAELLAELSD